MQQCRVHRKKLFLALPAKSGNMPTAVYMAAPSFDPVQSTHGEALHNLCNITPKQRRFLSGCKRQIAYQPIARSWFSPHCRPVITCVCWSISMLIATIPCRSRSAAVIRHPKRRCILCTGVLINGRYPPKNKPTPVGVGHRYLLIGTKCK